MTITGALGELRCGYQHAATLRPWTVIHEENRWTLTGTLNRQNFWLSQQPLKFVTPNGWRWPVLTLQIEGASLTATLGPKESRYVSASATA
jgi:hypothetical protein